MPVPDWTAACKLAPNRMDKPALETFWWSAALTWLNALRSHLRKPYTINHTKNFMLLSMLDPRRVELTLEFCERTRVHILRSLEGVASIWGNGPHVVIVFNDINEYYDYIGNYYPRTGVFGMSSGLFIKQGYGHFVFVSSHNLSVTEPIIAHELTHCLLAPLPLPAWLNEGTAVNMEKQIVPFGVDPRRGIYLQHEQAERRAAFWNAQTIQEFWSGTSFTRPDEGNAFSYELAEVLTRMVARNYEQYRAFMHAAHYKDAGSEATRSCLGYSLDDLASAVLGEGPWAPDPSKWHQGTERGQF